MWESRRDLEMDSPWAEAGPYWHRAMRQFAEATIQMLSHDH
jgi:hypothetical protein